MKDRKGKIVLLSQHYDIQLYNIQFNRIQILFLKVKIIFKKFRIFKKKFLADLNWEHKFYVDGHHGRTMAMNHGP